MIDIKSMLAFRHDLHKIPELDRNLPKTKAYITSVLSELACELTFPIESAVCAYFDNGSPQTVAFRTDMDALPVTENTGLPFASTHAGNMHACGHDGHMAMMLALALEVDKTIKTLPNNVLLIFQPAEETSGGARDICETGILKKYNVSHIFGMHLWPALPCGQVATRRGDMLAKSSELNVDIFGKSTHIARAWEGNDALLAGVRFINEAYKMNETEIAPDENRLLKFGMLNSGTVRNAISAKSEIRGSLRSFAPSTFDFMKGRLYEIASDIEKTTGCTFEITLSEGYPAVINHDGLYNALKDYYKQGFPVILPEPYMIAEDFSYYGLEVPSMFFLLGAGRDEPLHSDKFDFDDHALLAGAAFFTTLLNFTYNP